MSVVRVRVELRELHPSAGREDRDFSFRKMHSAFKKAVTDAGVLHEYKQHEYYESPSEIKRRKKRESDLQKLKAKLRENFPQKKSSKKPLNKNGKPNNNNRMNNSFGGK